MAMMTARPTYGDLVLTRLRRARRPIARLTVALMLLPAWLSFMVAASPAVAALLDQQPGFVGTICTPEGLKQIGDPGDLAAASLDCTACHISGCSMVPALTGQAKALFTTGTNEAGLATLSFAAEAALGHDPPAESRPRAPPLT